ncbi:unnamed protein product [Staurois parvus]|uniref:Uncharacterized protein n=1 Tax=Staurois parvus TaxID=386267 RepID=A0ABN9HUB9_9NEOB|nr:unnamed protein product [Staurois parvus]
MKGTRGISWGPLLTLGPQAVPEWPNGQSTPGPQAALLSSSSSSSFFSYLLGFPALGVYSRNRAASRQIRIRSAPWQRD